MIQKIYIRIVVGLCVAALIGLAFFLRAGTNMHASVTQQASAAAFASATSTQFSIGNAISNAVVSSSVPRQAPTGSKEYRSSQYGFSLFYPDSLTATEYDEGAGAKTITFQNPSQGLGFQIFVVPYTSSQVTTARFEQDEPSGIHTNIKNGLVAGATAAAFDGRDAVLGDTYEVWILHGGYLYEITTLKPLDTWLQQIVPSWQFI